MGCVCVCVCVCVCEKREYRNTLSTVFAQAFQNDHHNITDAMQGGQSSG